MSIVKHIGIWLGLIKPRSTAGEPLLLHPNCRCVIRDTKITGFDERDGLHFQDFGAITDRRYRVYDGDLKLRPNLEFYLDFNALSASVADQRLRVAAEQFAKAVIDALQNG